MTSVGKNDMHPSFTETTRSIDNNTAVEKNDMHPPFLDTKRSIDNNTAVENNNIHLPFPDTKRCGKENICTHLLEAEWARLGDHDRADRRRVLYE